MKKSVKNKYKKYQRILADDPGSVNYGRSIVDVYKFKDKLKFELKDVFLVRQMLTNLTGDVENATLEYMQSIAEFETAHGPFDCYVAERYMNRGIRGTLIELISFMLCMNINTFDAPVKKLLAAVTWKGPFKKIYDLDLCYKAIKPAPPHVLDATLMAIYMAHFNLGLKPFEKFTQNNLLKIIDQIHLKGNMK